MSATVIRGSSEPIGSWKMICISLRSAFMRRCGSLVTSRPSNSMRPEVGSTNRSTVRPSVDFPQPDSPTRPSVSPGFRFNETSSTALT